MKAILLVGGRGTRLRPLTIHVPKPIVPIFDRPFLRYQLDLLKQVPEIDEAVLSLNYQPRRIEELFGDGSEEGLGIKYVIEPQPLGTAGAVRYAGESLRESVVVLNGDVLAQIDLAGVIALHRERKAKATIVLVPVDDPSAYGVVETDASQNILRFLEKPNPHEITSNTINAGIYVLEPDTFDRIPKETPWSIERSFFPSLVERGESFVAYVHRGYWIDIGTPEKYLQVHRDIMDGHYRAAPFAETPARAWISPHARVDEGVEIEGPCFVDEGTVVKAGARLGAYSVVGKQCHIEERAVVERSIVWANTRVSQDATVRRSILGRQCHVGRNATIDDGVVLGDKSVVTDFSRL
jgi:NDP-sugar pyrophosphorylase family protein